MNCPKCNHIQTCPCDSCQSRTKTEKPWVWVSEEDIGCGECGFQKNANWWMDRAWEEYKKKQEEAGAGE